MAIAKLPAIEPPSRGEAPVGPAVVRDDRAESPPAFTELHLQRQLLVERLASLGAASAIAELRSELEQLRTCLANPADPLHADSGEEAVSIPASYLAGELDQIGAALTIDRARYYVERLARAVSVERTGAINEINLNRWKAYDDILTDSLWLIDRRDSTGVHSAGYWGNFIPQIPNQLMRRYTRRGDWVLDPFVGSGTTTIEAQRLGRNSLGIELQPQIAERARAVVESEPNRHGTQSHVLVGDSTNTDFCAMLEARGVASAQLALLHPPYHDIIRFSDNPRDLSNAPSTEQFLALIGQVVDNVGPALERGRHLALVIGDTYAHGEWSPLGFLAMNEVLGRGFALKSIVVKNIDGTTGKRSQKELWRYRALAGGFYVFKHEYIFLFKKR